MRDPLSGPIEIFVPGRICLFGEHSDWAGGYRRLNSDIEKGYTIICGTNQGLYARVYPNESDFVCHSSSLDQKKVTFRCKMEADVLLSIAEEGGFWSYVAGVAYQIVTHYHVKGLEVDNYKTDLPAKKGLSSSAAACVMIARAFNRLYDLKMTIRGEMEMAYRGEITTPSRCGRMDQGCAYGNKPVLMIHDGDMLQVEELAVSNDLHFVIVDLKAKKDTIKILKDLNEAYPFADDDTQLNVQRYLGAINKELVVRAVGLIEEGDAEGIGRLMAEAQREFDENLEPACPEELAAPVLHDMLSLECLAPLALGGKGVGSQGDGAVQFVCLDVESQRKLAAIVERDLGMESLTLTLRASARVRKAVITAAGLGTRLYPATKVIRKELMPVVDEQGRIKPLIIQNIEEAVASGVEEVCLVIREADYPVFEKLLLEPSPPEVFGKLGTAEQEYATRLESLAPLISFQFQTEQKGLGHAVLCAKDFVDGEPFLLILGDHHFVSDTGTPCSVQLVRAFEGADASLVGMAETDESDIHRYGTVAGLWRGENGLMSITEICEKPAIDYARERLSVEGVPHGMYLTAFGLYVLSSRVMTELELMVAEDDFEKGELQLTTALERTRVQEGVSGYRIRGKRVDIGTPAGYRAVFA